MELVKLPKLLSHSLIVVLVITSAVLLVNCNSKFDSNRRTALICKKWVYSKETIWDKQNEMNKLQTSSSSLEQLAGLFGNQALNLISSSIIEFKNTGGYLRDNSEKGLSLFLGQVGSWKYNFWGTKLYLTIEDKTTTYEIEELTENSLQLSYKQGSVKIIEKFIPYVEKKQDVITYYEDGSRITFHNNDLADDSRITIEDFNHEEDILFGRIIKSDSTDERYIFIRNDENKTCFISINNELLNPILENEGKISNTLFFEDYNCKDYTIRIEYKVNNELVEYNNKFEATMIISKDGKREVFKNLYSESRYD